MQYKTNYRKCTKDPETCPVVDDIIEFDTFEEQIQEMDPDSKARRIGLGNFVTACAIGSCPGQNYDFFNRLAIEKLE